jgi:hypothetical protein
VYDFVVSRGAVTGDQVQVRSGRVGSGQLMGVDLVGRVMK